MDWVIVGGANGTGKTTFATEYARRHTFAYLAADAIASELSPGAPEKAALAAGEELLRRIRTAARRQASRSFWNRRSPVGQRGT